MFVVPNYGAAVLEVVGLGLMIAGLVLGLIVALLFIVNAFRGSPRSKRLDVAFATVVALLGGGWMAQPQLSAAVGGCYSHGSGTRRSRVFHEARPTTDCVVKGEKQKGCVEDTAYFFSSRSFLRSVRSATILSCSVSAMNEKFFNRLSAKIARKPSSPMNPSPICS